MTMELDEAAVRARLEAATPGPWRVENLGSHGEDSWALDIARFRNYTNTVDFGADLATAEFIAHARTDLPAALDEITRLRAALDESEAGRARLRRVVAEEHIVRVKQVTPCSCSAQRARAEAAEKERDEAQAEVERVSEDRDDFDRGLAAAIEQRDAAEAERDRAIETASHEQHLARQWWERAVAAESALAAVRALVGSVGPRSATAGSPYSTGRWDAFAEVRAALDGETEDGVFGDPDIHARLTRERGE